MLAELYVEDFALIESLQVDFYNGLNIISGETGAGKSLLTDAVGLLMGNRADKELIRYGSKRALVEGTFIGPFFHGFLEALSEYGLNAEDDTLVVTREINSEGKNLCRINGRRVSLTVLSEIIPLLMNLHSQREHFTFLKEEGQIHILDRFGGDILAAASKETAQAYSRWHSAIEQTRKLKKQNEAIGEKQDYLLYRIKEIEELSLKPHEDERLRQEIRLLKSGTQRLTDSVKLYEKLSISTEQLYGAMTQIKTLAALDETLQERAQTVTEAYYNIEDIRDTIINYRDSIEADPQALNEAEQRLSDIESLKKKENTDLDGILENYEIIKAEVESLEDFDYLLAKLIKEESEAATILEAAAMNLRQLRTEVGQKLSLAIVEELHALRLVDGQFTVGITDAPLSEKGKDKVSFLISMNKGEELKPLSKVASGGEISRILLALKVILGSIDNVQTMIFDEIDSGMGGKTATAVGEKIAQLATNIQVFAVTHSPIIAAQAQHHFYIEKVESENRTNVALTRLEGESIKGEIARMLSGDETSEASLIQATELLTKAKNAMLKQENS